MRPMIKLLILADDFTGALDSGVQLAKVGTPTRVVTDLAVDFCSGEITDGVEALVIDTETRHLDAPQAKSIVYGICKRAVMAGIGTIYKKTDSALRGNIGAELEGALLGSAEKILCFIPAFPKLGRTTVNGIHYFNGVPIHETVFGSDPFDPVHSAEIKSIIGEQSSLHVHLESDSTEPLAGREPQIVLFDAADNEALQQVARRIKNKYPIRVLAGCAGFAEYLPQLLNLQRREFSVCLPSANLFVISGTLNPITSQQLKTAQEHGFPSIILTAQQKLQGVGEDEAGERFLDGILREYQSSGRLILMTGSNDTGADDSGKQREVVSRNIGKIVYRLLKKGLNGTLVVTGGDTLQGVLEQLHCVYISPVCEIETGVALSYATLQNSSLMLISKSGGIGSIDVFRNMERFLQGTTFTIAGSHTA